MLNERGGIEAIAAGPVLVDVNVSDEQAGRADVDGQFIKRAEVVLHKSAFGEQVARRITGNRQFRCEHQVRARRNCPPVSVTKARAVSGQVANGRIQLRQGQSHSRKSRRLWSAQQS